MIILGSVRMGKEFGMKATLVHLGRKDYRPRELILVFWKFGDLEWIADCKKVSYSVVEVY